MAPKITVTQPHMPPIEDFLPYLERIWESKILTNGGPLHQQLETELQHFLGVDHLSLFANGTLGLLAALKVLNISGEVITTPYTFVATVHALRWAGLEPVFADIDPVTLNLDPGRIEAAITPRTSAIMAVHCYGTPCDTSAIANVANRHGLKVIYDAAHAFGVADDNGSLLLEGDLSVLSFHATKVFSTGEGGAVVSHDVATQQRLNRSKNFGYLDEVTIGEVGINAKLPELSAAFGLAQLKQYEAARARRREIDRFYRDALSNIPGLRCLAAPGKASANYGYFPVFVDSAYPLRRDKLYQALHEAGIQCRRYFYPLVSDFPMYANLATAAPANLPVARSAASQVICLPIYPALTEADQMRIVDLILTASRI